MNCIKIVISKGKFAEPFISRFVTKSTCYRPVSSLITRNFDITITAFVILIVAWLISLILGITKISSFIRNSEMCVLVCKKKKQTFAQCPQRLFFTIPQETDALSIRM